MALLRSYQHDLVTRTRSALASPGSRRVMVQLPTGGGKTVLAAELLRQAGSGTHCWLTHRDHLRAQTAAALRAHTLTVHDLHSQPPRARAWQPHAVNILPVGVEPIPPPPDAGLMIVDEAHHAVAGSWRRHILRWPGSAAGLTATPWRLDRREKFSDWQLLICGPTAQQLTHAGWLAQATTVLPEHRMSSTLARDSFGEIAASAAHTETMRLLRVINVTEWHSSMLRGHLTDPKTARTLWYCATASAAQAVTARLDDSALILAATPPHERRSHLDAFRSGRLRHIVNVDVLTEGIDIPDVDCVVVMRPTESVALHLQIIGRSLRPPGPVLIIDAAGNSLRHGSHLDERTWTLHARSDPQQAPGDQPHTSCPKCAIANPAGARRCRACDAPLGRECGGCRRWAHHTRYRTRGCVECAECEQQPAASSDLDRARRAAADPGSPWQLTPRGLPTVTSGGITWMITSRGVTVQRPATGGEWQPAAAAPPAV